MLDDRERDLLEEIERALVSDRRLRKRWDSRSTRLRRAFTTWSLAALVVVLAAVAVGLLALALPGQSLVIAIAALWPVIALRRRLVWRRSGRRGAARTSSPEET